MKLVNKTAYPTATLRSIMCAVHSAERRGRLKTWNALTVEIIYSKRGNRKYTGHAYYRGHKAVLSVPRQGYTYDSRPCEGLDVKRFAALWRHEMWHLYGLHHDAYPPNIMYCRPECVSHVRLGSFVETLGMDVPEVKPKPSKEDRQAVKVAGLLRRRATWATKEKRAQTALRKINTSLRYYEKQGFSEAEPQAARPRKRVSERTRRILALLNRKRTRFGKGN